MQEFEEDVRILRLLKPKLPERPVILDVGASNGRWTREIVKIFPGATVFLFEPGTAYTDEMLATLNSHDIQAGELAALKGAIGTLPSVRVLHLETWIMQAYGGKIRCSWT